jgi:Polyketide cyclase / dehydrase and lipid transport
MCAMADTHAEATEVIAADAGALYDLVADLTQMGKWSPEAQGGRWVGGASGPTVGAKFRGNNKAGWRRWSTTAQVTAAERGKRFAFHITFTGVPIADWSYDFVADGDATKVVEEWTDCRPGWMNALSGPVMGVSDRAAHNQRNMETTLATLKKAAESPAS